MLSRHEPNYHTIPMTKKTAPSPATDSGSDWEAYSKGVGKHPSDQNEVEDALLLSCFTQEVRLDALEKQYNYLKLNTNENQEHSDSEMLTLSIRISDLKRKIDSFNCPKGREVLKLYVNRKSRQVAKRRKTKR